MLGACPPSSYYPTNEPHLWLYDHFSSASSLSAFVIQTSTLQTRQLHPHRVSAGCPARLLTPPLVKSDLAPADGGPADPTACSNWKLRNFKLDSLPDFNHLQRVWLWSIWHLAK